MMSKKQSRWPEALVNSKSNKSTQKAGGKELAASTVPVSRGGKPAGSSNSNTCVINGRSSSLSNRGGDLTAPGSKAGGSLKRGSLNHQRNVCHQGTRPASRPARPAPRLSSSRSFTSLHTSSLTAAPFKRSSRSLGRLDQRSTDAVPGSQVKKEQVREKKVLNSDQLSSSEEQIRVKKDQCHDDNTEKMETSCSPEPQESSSSVDFSAQCHHHCNKTRDGVYTLCAMTSGMRHNWVQSVLKNVRPSLTLDLTSSLPDQTNQQESAQPDSQSTEGQEKAAQPKGSLHEHKSRLCAEETHQQQKEEELRLQPEREQSSADGSSASSMIPISHLSSPVCLPPSPPPPPLLCPPPEVEGASSHHCTLLVAAAQTGGSDALLCAEGAGTDVSTPKLMLTNDELADEQSNMRSDIEQQDKSMNISCEFTKVKEKLPCEQQTGQLVKELEQTQKELCRLQQLNRNLQDELQQERESHWRELIHSQNDLLSNSPAEQVVALQQLQKMNHDLRCELEAQKRSQEEAREDELRRRVDLLAQQAQLLVTGDATALAQANVEQDRQRFHELQVEWERSVPSLKSQLSVSEEKRKEAELRLTQLQQELQNFHSLQQEADCLQNHLQEVTAELQSNEEAQAQKEARLQKHLMLLQASQERERRSLATSLAQAEQHSQDLQERLDRAEEQVEGLTKTQTWTRDIEKAQQQLQEELACTVFAVQQLQEEKDRLDHHCRELQNQLSEADGEVSMLQNRLKTDETHYYNLEHSYERVCEELQLALGKVQERESDTQDIREGYERLLDRKEQELSEVLLKMEVLGNSLEETEVQLNEVLKVCTCASSQLNDESPEPAQRNESQQMTDPLAVNDSGSQTIDSGQLSNSSIANEHTKTSSHSIDSSYQSTVTAGDDPERFISVIKLLETKLYVTEEKLRDIMQRLEEHQGHMTCQDPHLCSQLTQSRATAQHLSLLLHSQAKQSQRFAQETEQCCRMLVGRFKVALNIIQGCKERLRATPINIIDFEKQLASAAACLQQGQKDAEKQQLESHNAGKGEDKILNDETFAGGESSIVSKGKLNNTLPSEDYMESVGRCFMTELFVVERMASVLQSQQSIEQLSLVTRECEGDMVHRYKHIMSHRIVMNSEERIQSGRAECGNNVPLNKAIGRVCAEAELIHAALKFQHENMAQINNQEVVHQMKGLADISPPEMAPYDEQVEVESRGLEGAAKPIEKDDSDFKKVETDKVPEWLERLLTRLQRRAECLRQLLQEISDGSGVELDDKWENATASELNWMQEQAKLIYLWDRLHLDLEQELEQSEALQDKLQSLCKEQDITWKNEQEAFNRTLRQLREENSELRAELEHTEEKIISTESGNQRLLEDIQKIKDHHEDLEKKFQEKIRELQQIHEEEMKRLHGFYTKACSSKEKQTKTCPEALAVTGTTSYIPDQTVKERKSTEDLGNRMTSGDEGFSAMDEMHKKLIGELQHQHQKEVAALQKEKDKLLQEETAATMAAIIAVRRAHKQELERIRQSQHIKQSDDITQLHIEHEKEIRSLHKELELLSFQLTQKCLENSQLSQELEDERQSLMQWQTENQELQKKQRETDEKSQLHFLPNGKQSHVAPPVNDFYEMEVILRAREAEMHFLRQEARSLKDELKIARMDKIYAQNKLQALYTNSQDEPHYDANNLCEDLKFATWSPSKDASGRSLEDTVTNPSNSTFLKKAEKSSLTRQIRVVRSKSLKEGLSIQERMKLFESF